MSFRTREYRQLRAAVTEVLNTHDLLGVLDLGAPADEYDPEAEDFIRMIAKGEPVTPEMVAAVWHEWFGDRSGEPEPSTSRMMAMAEDLSEFQQAYGGGQHRE